MVVHRIAFGCVIEPCYMNDDCCRRGRLNAAVYGRASPAAHRRAARRLPVPDRGE
jgi:hypothetical protein